jgi:O-succinylbenzoate synthase
VADALIPSSAAGQLTHATVRLVRLPVRASLGAAHDERPAEHRELVFVAGHADGDTTVVQGWGECSALNAPTYTAEWAAGAYASLVSGAGIDAAAEPMAAAALEMAELDAELRSSGQSLAERLGTAGHSAPAGAAVGLAPIPTMLDEIETLAADGYPRIKCKIAPGRVVEPVRAIISRFPDLEVQVDANGSLSADDIPLLKALRDLGVRAVEQPFAIAEHGLAGRLVAETDLAIVADEAVNTPDDLWAIARDQAATGVSIKPPRVGGLRQALALVDAAVTAGMQCSVGGMLESGLGRHLLAALAPLEPFTIIGDLSPARRWLAIDPFADITMTDGTIAAPTTVGIAGDPDLEMLDHHTVEQATVEFPRVVP